MARKDEGMSLFPEIFTATKKLSDAQFGALIRAAREYQIDGSDYEGDDIAVDIAFRFVSDQLDRRREAGTRKAAAANSRWSKEDTTDQYDNDAEPMQNDAEPMQNDAEPMQNDAPILSYPILSNPILSNIRECTPTEPPAPPKEPDPKKADSRKAYGKYRWVKLTDAEYNRLLSDLGSADTERYISIVDELAQMTGNKNKWKDWNLTVRKAHRERWGQTSSCFSSRRQDIPKGASGNLGEAELESINRVLREA